MARKIPHYDVPASFDGGDVHLALPLEGIRKIKVTSVLFVGYLMFKGWGSPNDGDAVPLEGAMLGGQLIGLFQISPGDPELGEYPTLPKPPQD